MKKIKILLVDDIFLNRILLQEIITEIGLFAVEAKNGKEAIEILQKEKDIDLVLMDIEMPVMNGFETTRYIRQKFSAPQNSIPVVAITAHDPNSFMEEFNNIGFNQLISKPYTIDKISLMIKTIFGD